ncbi:hypothetical protein PVK06_024250 [Gossypium arboreum]|uniref:Uncharacterized protein n=1 Tax=Gossypium arboreum TaxID=29729 RepID=A0ABR0PDD5_GOSAR|nr:hypothetical protein PVK06_024250 [Gossypium arboreum]
MKEQLKEYVVEDLNSNMDMMKKAINVAMDNQIEKNDARSHGNNIKRTDCEAQERTNYLQGCFWLKEECSRRSDLFILKKAKGIPVRKLTKNIKTVNSEKVSTLEVAQLVKLRIGQWKGKEDFEVIHFDDYDFILGLNFLNKINALLVPFVDCICILDTHQQ